MPFITSIGIKLLLMIASLYLFAMAQQQDNSYQMSAWLWPKIILIALVVSLLVGITRDVLSRTWAETRRLSVESQKKTWPFLGAIVVTVAYVVTLRYIGFFLANGAFLVTLMVISGYRRVRTIVLVGLLGPVLLSFIFQKFLVVVFPVGVSLFGELTVGIYRFLHIY